MGGGGGGVKASIGVFFKQVFEVLAILEGGEAQTFPTSKMGDAKHLSPYSTKKRVCVG